MRISLIYNEHAGSGLSVPDLRHDIERHGHQVVRHGEIGTGSAAPAARSHRAHRGRGRRRDGKARGDRTVWAAGYRSRSSRSAPPTTSPAASASRIPRTKSSPAGGRLAACRSISASPTARGMVSATLSSRSVAAWWQTASSSWTAKHLTTKRRPDQMIEKALWRFRDVLAALHPHRCRLTLDGVTQEVEVLLVEVLNIVSVGPGLRLIDGAEPDDGQFDVVTAGDEHRLEIERYLRDRIEGRPARLRLPSRRGRQVEMSGWKRIHLDDSVHTEVVNRPLHLRVDRAALEILVPYPT